MEPLRRPVMGLVSRAELPDNLDHMQTKLLIIYGIFAGICCIVVGCRIYVRTIRLNAFKMDDWLMVLAQILNLLGLVCFTLSVRWGQGKHPKDVQGKWWVPLLHWFIVYTCLVVLSLSVAKISIGFHLLRLTNGMYYRRFLQVLNIFLVILTIVSVLVVLLECLPLEAKWNYQLRPPNGPAKCIPTKVYVRINLTLNAFVILTDIIFALVPIPIIRNLSISRNAKIVLGIILGFGSIACFAGILKIYYGTHALDANGHDALMDFFVWQIAENNLAIIVASLPTLRPLVRSVHGRFYPSHPISSNEGPKLVRSPISPLSGNSYMDTLFEEKKQFNVNTTNEIELEERCRTRT